MTSTKRMMTSLHALNQMTQSDFTRVCGALFEHSPWIAERAWSLRPFNSIDGLHQALCHTMFAASREEHVKLIAAHPDLVGRMAQEGKLTRESTAEQKAAGLGDLLPDEIQAFDRYNATYREKFGFPFVICARENKKAAILAAFPVRLNNTPEAEIQIALHEIAKIAKLRLADVVEDR